jgi:hypothetical protein
MAEIENIVNDDLKTTTWLGIVEDNEDPKREGRCRIRVFGKFDSRVDPEDLSSSFIIPTEHLPWARQCTNITGGSDTGGGFLSFPKRGSIVSVKFNEGNIYMPEYYYNVHVSDEVKTEIGNSYQNSHVLIYDTAFGLDQDGNNSRSGESIKLFFTEERGLVIDYATTSGSSVINIRPDNSVQITNANGDSINMQNDGNITFTHSAKLIINTSNNTEINCKDAVVACENMIVNSTNSIELGANANEKVVLGDSFLTLFNQHTHIGNLGAPTSPPTPLVMTQAQLSQHTKTQ